MRFLSFSPRGSIIIVQFSQGFGVETYSFLGAGDTARDRSQRLPQIARGHVAGVLRFRRFPDKILGIERNRRRAHGPPLVVRLLLHARGFRELVGTLAEKLAEELVLGGRVLIFGGAALSLLLLAALLGRLSLRGRRALLRILLVGRYQRLVL